MPLFTVSRRNDPAGALLVIDAKDQADAILRVQEHEEIGGLYEHGYADGPDGYAAAPATEDQGNEWSRSLRLAKADGDVEEGEPGWIAFLRAPEFGPTIDDD
jgi:hypothetical protein